ncbi:MAG: S8 family serine peptidase [Rhodoferax sp.]
MKFLAVVLGSLVLSACGGGDSGSTTTGTGGTPSGTAPAYSITEPVPVPIAALVLGAPHADFSAPYGTATVTLPGVAVANGFQDLSGSYPQKTQTIQFAPTDHLTPDLVNKVWANGWNGYGQSISVIDDFQSGGLALKREFLSRRETTDVRSEFNWVKMLYENNIYVGNYDVEYSFSQDAAHGAIVANIAGGDEQGTAVQTGMFMTPFSVNPISCAKNGVASNAMSCGNLTTFGSPAANFAKQYSSWLPQQGWLDYRKVAGVAKSASVSEQQVNLSRNQNPYESTIYIYGHLENSYQSSATNLSLGVALDTSGVTLEKVYENTLTRQLLTKKSESVIAIAAGNSSSPCGANNLAGCNYYAAYFSITPQTKDSVLVVGATTGSGSNEKLADYSSSAGALASRFILTSGDTGYDGVVGTSFAAPRVAGAVAIVRQKYPKLTATQAANLLLLTANKDINNDGIDDFVGVSPIYGHGKLDLVKALSPIGTTAIGQ